MNSLTESVPGENLNERPKSGFLDRLDVRLEAIAERCNPILIKEARQALKSRQFTITFILLLSAGWGWSLMGAVIHMPEIYYSPTGDVMLAGYYIILSVALLVIIPFSAFRSLAAEREDGTYELLSITTLSSRQIVTGKLGSAIVQMIVYYSALAPCIVFTYLLRGVDILTIIFLLTYTFMGSLLLSALGLLFASLSGTKNSQILLTVLLLLLLIFSSIGWLGSFIQLLEFGADEIMPYGEVEFWIGNAAFLSAYFSYLSIIILTSASRTSFASDNKSTKLRIAMFVQTVLFVGWFSWVWSISGFPEALLAGVFIAGAHWFVYAAFLVGESSTLSPRVKRSLPATTAGRTFLTWFNPGSGTAYIFVVINFAVISGLAIWAYFIQEYFGLPERPAFANRPSLVVEGILLTLAYFTFYLGIGRIILLLFPGREKYGFVLPFLVNVLIPVSGCLVPIAIHSFSRTLINAGYTRWQFTNWAWSLAEIADRRLPYPELPWVMGAVAFVVFLINLILAAREVEAVRMVTPQRVQQEEAELAAAK